MAHNDVFPPKRRTDEDLLMDPTVRRRAIRAYLQGSPNASKMVALARLHKRTKRHSRFHSHTTQPICGIESPAHNDISLGSNRWSFGLQHYRFSRQHWSYWVLARLRIPKKRYYDGLRARIDEDRIRVLLTRTI